MIIATHPPPNALGPENDRAHGPGFKGVPRTIYLGIERQAETIIESEGSFNIKRT